MAERGATTAESAFISVPLSALLVSHGVLRARMFRVWFAGFILLLMALFGVVALAVAVGALGGLAADPAADGESGFHVRIGL